MKKLTQKSNQPRSSNKGISQKFSLGMQNLADANFSQNPKSALGKDSALIFQNNHL